jgi:hypothetical protein
VDEDAVKSAIWVSAWDQSARRAYEGHDPEETQVYHDVLISGLGERDASGLPFDDTEREIAALVEGAIRYIPSVSLAGIARFLNVVLVRPPVDGSGRILDASVLARAGRLRRLLDVGESADRDAFLRAMLSPDQDLFWKALDPLMHTLRRMVKNGNRHAKQRAREHLARVMSDIVLQIDDIDEDSAVRALALGLMAYLKPHEHMRMIEMARALAPDDREALERLESEDEFRRFGSALEIWGSDVVTASRVYYRRALPFLVRYLRREGAARGAEAGPSAPVGSPALPNPFLCVSRSASGDILGYQVAEPGVKRRAVYLTHGLWSMIAGNPLALAQLLGHEAVHVDPHKLDRALSAEERAAAEVEVEVRRRFDEVNPGHSFLSLDEILPHIASQEPPAGTGR